MKPQVKTFVDRHEGGERALLLHVDFERVDDEAFVEFIELSRSSGVDILEAVRCRREKPDSKYFVGKGKAEELKQLVDFHQADVMIINHDISPAQGRNLEKLLGILVLTRTELILDIFATRAKSYEGKLQVELAQLQHLSTRLVRGWTHLERQKGGIGLRGPGETQLETDKRLLAAKVKQIKKRLDKVMKQREQGRRSRERSNTPTVGLVGYTNAGKSTLFNALTDSGVYAKDQLFATLDTTIRQLSLPYIGECMLADTVGFIRDLPHELVAAFKSTLDETRKADLLLHVVDCASDEARDMVEHVANVLAEIDADQVPQLLVMNKIDLMTDMQEKIVVGDMGLPARVYVSAKSGKGLDLLLQAIGQCLQQDMIEQEVVIAPEQGKLRAQLYQLNAVLAETINQDGEVVLRVRLSREDYRRYCG